MPSRAEAFRTQAGADWLAFQRMNLAGSEFEPCHRAMLFQMAVEKCAKADLFAGQAMSQAGAIGVASTSAGGNSAQKLSHAVVAQWMQVLPAASRSAYPAGVTAHDVADVLSDIELGNPSVAAAKWKAAHGKSATGSGYDAQACAPNVEYPWVDPSTGDWTAPASVTWPMAEARPTGALLFVWELIDGRVR